MIKNLAINGIQSNFAWFLKQKYCTNTSFFKGKYEPPFTFYFSQDISYSSSREKVKREILFNTDFESLWEWVVSIHHNNSSSVCKTRKAIMLQAGHIQWSTEHKQVVFCKAKPILEMVCMQIMDTKSAPGNLGERGINSRWNLQWAWVSFSALAFVIHCQLWCHGALWYNGQTVGTGIQVLYMCKLYQALRILIWLFFHLVYVTYCSMNKAQTLYSEVSHVTVVQPVT